MTVARIRPLEPVDAERLASFLDRLTPASVYGRFFTRFPRVPEALLRQLVAVDHTDHEALVLQSGDDIVGLASYHRDKDDATTAEVAVVVQDTCQRTGVARLLLRRLARLARRRGIDRLSATVLGDNRPALALTRALSPGAKLTVDGPEVTVVISLLPESAHAA